MLTLEALGGAAPATAAPVSAAATVAARTHAFGRDNVDQRTGAVRRDRVILSWFGVTNFAMSIRGHVQLLDAWVPRGLYSGVVPTGPDELAALRPEHILIGHTHYDHAVDAVPIAQASGATIVGDAEARDYFRGRTASTPIRCRAAVPAGVSPGTIRPVPGLIPGVQVVAMKNLHSSLTPPTELRAPLLPVPTDNVLTHPPTAQDLAELLAHLGDPESGSTLYRFQVGGFSLLWNDSAGPLVDRAPAAITSLRSLRPIDVQVGSIEGFNEITNGFRDPATYLEALRPKAFIPTHHDDWQPGLTTHASVVKPQFLSEFERIPSAWRPKLTYLEDPADYLNPRKLTWPVAVPAPMLQLRCLRDGHTRATLGGDTTDVSNVRFRRPGAPSRIDSTEPWTRSLRAPRRRHLDDVRATVTYIDGTTGVLHRRPARCARRR